MKTANNMPTATTVLLLVLAIASFAAASASDNVFMVVDEHLTSSSGGDDVMQHGYFKLADGKELTLPRRGQAEKLGCIGDGQPCGAFHWCCDPLSCSSYFKGKCSKGGCIPFGGFCFAGDFSCCTPNTCRGGGHQTITGICAL